MLTEIHNSLRVIGLTIAICVVAYPLSILAVATVISPDARTGSLVIDDDGVIRGSRLIAQNFSQPKYFWPRPSACNYDASAACGSNLSPANPAVRERGETIIANLAAPEGQVAPADLLTASGGGLDPHISYPAALLQAPRVAKERGMSENDVTALIRRQAAQVPMTSDDASRIVNVLELNLTLDAANSSE